MQRPPQGEDDEAGDGPLWPVCRLAAAAALLFLLAGCAAAPAAPEAPPAQPAAGPAPALDWSQSGCESITWAIPVPASSLRPLLPAGFEPALTPAPAGAPGDLQAATLAFQAIECVAGHGQDPLRPVQSGFVFTPVLPPPELRDDRFAASTRYGWDVLVATNAWRDGAAGWGLPLRDGGASILPATQGWGGSLALDGVGSFAVSGRPLEPLASAAGTAVRTITPGAQGYALWDSVAENRTAAAGLGVWEASPESWVAQVVGATQGVATFQRETWDLPHATVRWPGQGHAPVG